MANNITFRNDRTQSEPYDDAKFNAQDSNEIVDRFNEAVPEINANNAKVTYPSADSTKLAGIDAGAQVNPTQASAGEITAGTETAVRGHSPADIVSYIGQHETAQTSPVHLTYADTAAMIADQGNQKQGFLYYVTDSPQKTYFEYLGTTVGDLTDYRGGGVLEETVVLSLGNYTADIAVETGKAYWEVPWNCDLVGISGALLVTAPTGSSAIFDVNRNGTSIMTTNKIEIEAGENSSRTATQQPVLTTGSLIAGDIIACDIDQIGSTVAGVGPSVTINLTRTS